MMDEHWGQDVGYWMSFVGEEKVDRDGEGIVNDDEMGGVV